jgi:hypothetical protein
VIIEQDVCRRSHTEANDAPKASRETVVQERRTYAVWIRGRTAEERRSSGGQVWEESGFVNPKTGKGYDFCWSGTPDRELQPSVPEGEYV